MKKGQFVVPPGENYDPDGFAAEVEFTRTGANFPGIYLYNSGDPPNRYLAVNGIWVDNDGAAQPVLVHVMQEVAKNTPGSVVTRRLGRKLGPAQIYGNNIGLGTAEPAPAMDVWQSLPRPLYSDAMVLFTVPPLYSLRVRSGILANTIRATFWFWVQYR
jgi:hypothetical protein